MIADPEGPSFITRTVGHRRYADGASVTHNPSRKFSTHRRSSRRPITRDEIAHRPWHRRNRSNAVHDYTLALWRLSGLDGLPILQRAGPRDIRRLRQNRLQALSPCSISVALWGCERSGGLGNRQDRAAPNPVAGPLLQAEWNALERVPSPL